MSVYQIILFQQKLSQEIKAQGDGGLSPQSYWSPLFLFQGQKNPLKIKKKNQKQIEKEEEKTRKEKEKEPSPRLHKDVHETKDHSQLFQILNSS